MSLFMVILVSMVSGLVLVGYAVQNSVVSTKRGDEPFSCDDEFPEHTHTPPDDDVDV